MSGFTSGFFSAELRERVRAANDIVDVIGACLPLKKAGGNFQALCPFHKEKTPSFNVNPSLQIFKCFGCGKGGDVFTFVMAYENVEFPEAVKRLADRANIPIEHEQGNVEGHAKHLKDSLLQIHEQITQRWQNALAGDAAGQIARDYLAKRGVSAEAITLFRIGYAPELWDDTVNWAKNKGFELPLVEKAGLVIRKDSTGSSGGDHYYDRFRGRLMFPICDERGRVVAFSGRVLSGDEKAAKYVNSPETPIFTKSKIFFGLDKSKRVLLEEEFAIICEGQLDLIACYMAGVRNVVAPQGTAFTSDHARILKRYVNEVVLCFDADEAGQNAAARSLDSMLATGLAVRVVSIPAPHDPDTFIKEFGAEAFRSAVQKAEGFFDWYLNRLCSLHDPRTDKGRLEIVAGMAEAVHKTGNGVLIDKYAQKTALRLGVSADSVRLEFKKARQFKRPQPEAPPQEESLTKQMQPPSPLEMWLLKILFLHEDLVSWAAANLKVEWLQHPLVAEACQKRFAAEQSGTWTNLTAFLDQCESEDLRQLITEVTVIPKPVPNPIQQLGDVTRRFRNATIDREAAALLHRASQPDITEAEKHKFLLMQQELREAKKVPLKPA
jgi:DNA primase